MKSLKVKLFSILSMFVIALAMLIIGVWAVGETQHINLSGNVDFTITDGNLYIKDIRMKDANDAGQGTTISNFIPGFIDSSFDLKLGTINADASFTLIIDVVNTSPTTYDASTNSTLPNGSISVSGRIEGDDVPLAEVATADISGQVTLAITQTSSGPIDLNLIDIILTEYIPLVYDYFTFEVNYDGKTVTLTDYNKNLSDSTDVVIPSTVSQNSSGEWIEGNTYTVTAIASASSTSNGVFYDSGITSVTFPSSLTSIGNSAFSGCSGLTGELNLGGCTSLTSIGKYAFQSCSGLIGELNLGECTGLTSIGDRAFDDCSGLTGTVTIPASVTEIGINPFTDCSNLEGIVVEDGNSEYYIEGNCLIENSTKTLITGFNNSTIPSDIKIIGDYAFYLCSGLTSITLPSSLTSIGRFAFDACRGLTGELNLGECTSLTSIGISAFQACRGLTSVDLSGCTNLTSIGWFAFSGCDGLTGELNLGECTSLTSIGWYAFNGCDGLTSVDLSGCTSLTSIESYAFEGCSTLKSVVFPVGSTGWYVTTSSTATSGTPVVVTNASTNASNLTGQYYNYYWKRNV